MKMKSTLLSVVYYPSLTKYWHFITHVWSSPWGSAFPRNYLQNLWNLIYVAPILPHWEQKYKSVLFQWTFRGSRQRSTTSCLRQSQYLRLRVTSNKRIQTRLSKVIRNYEHMDGPTLRQDIREPPWPLLLDSGCSPLGDIRWSLSCGLLTVVGDGGKETL